MRERASMLVLLAATALAACAEDAGDAEAPVAPPAPVGATAVAKLAAVSSTLSVEGTATWTTTDHGLDLRVYVGGCLAAHEYPVAIYANADCADAVARGEVWDVSRGAGIPRMSCDGGGGRMYYMRPNSDAKPWTIGGPAESNLLGHVLVVQDPATLLPLACGEIAMGEAVVQLDAGVAPGALPHPELQAQLAGFCISKAIASKVPGCPDPTKFAECAGSHCALDACVQTCSEHLACLATLSDSCSEAASCPISPACTECTNAVTTCATGPCALPMFACNAPTPGGPCTQVEECCKLQGPRADYCVNTVRMLAGIGGDGTCIGLMHDWDFNANVAFSPPCPFYDGGTGM